MRLSELIEQCLALQDMHKDIDPEVLVTTKRECERAKELCRGKQQLRVFEEGEKVIFICGESVDVDYLTS